MWNNLCALFHKFVDCLAQIINGFLVTGCYGINHAVSHVVFQNDLAGIVQRGADGGQLNQNVRTVLSVFYHTANLFQVTYGTGQAVDDSLLIFVDMTVRVRDAVSMQVGMVMFMLMVVIMIMFMLVIVFMGMHMVVRFIKMVGQRLHLANRYFCYYIRL